MTQEHCSTSSMCLKMTWYKLTVHVRVCVKCWWLKSTYFLTMEGIEIRDGGITKSTASGRRIKKKQISRSQSLGRWQRSHIWWLVNRLGERFMFTQTEAGVQFSSCSITGMPRWWQNLNSHSGPALSPFSEVCCFSWEDSCQRQRSPSYLIAV